jgi:anion-transporting  ArsA/GET3 family ATPase
VIERLRDRRIVICAGSGGVGKTTTSAAVAMGLAAEGRRVAVVTIDPARRLADSLGLAGLDNEPRLVDPQRFAGHGIVMEGELWAMMLDPKRTFDELIASLAPDAGAREDVLRNRIYQQLSAAVAGSQEFSAVAKLYELHHSGRFDVLVLDTPPSRNALDFLDAPDRLTGFLDGNALRMFLAPATGLAGRLVGAGTSVVLSVLRRLTGVDLIEDLGTFFRSLGSLIEAFRSRAEGVKALLRDPATTFLIVSSPEREAVEEAIFFRGKLADHGMPFGGLVVNRAHVLPSGAAEADDAADLEALEAHAGAALTRKVARAWAGERALAARDAAAIERLRAETGDEAPLVVPQLGGDVHDIDGLVAVHGFLFAGGDRAAAGG